MKRLIPHPSSSARRAFAATFATALVAAVLPFGPAFADDDPSESPSPSETAEPSEEPSRTPPPSPARSPPPSRRRRPRRHRRVGSTGYISAAWAAPVKIELYEPTIPIPSSPQGEVEVAYTEVEGDSSQSRGRSSYLWPGDPVGEGFKTFVEQLGFPPSWARTAIRSRSTPCTPPVPATTKTSRSPGSSSTPAPVRARPTPRTATPVTPRPRTATTRARGTTAGCFPACRCPDWKTCSPAARTRAAEDGEDGEGSSLGLPPELAAIIDLGGFTSRSELETLTEATATARSAFGDLAILDGLIRMEGLKVRAEVSSDGTSSEAGGVSAYGELIVLGQRFAFGPDGFVAVGEPTPIPGLPDDPGAALKELGITIKFPKPVYEKSADKASASVAGLVVEIDLGPLQKGLRQAAARRPHQRHPRAGSRAQERPRRAEQPVLPAGAHPWQRPRQRRHHPSAPAADRRADRGAHRDRGAPPRRPVTPAPPAPPPPPPSLLHPGPQPIPPPPSSTPPRPRRVCPRSSRSPDCCSSEASRGDRRRQLLPQDGCCCPRQRSPLSPRPRQRPARPPKGLT